MRKSITAASNIIPFLFEAREVRIMLISDQPWFVASDVALALMYRDVKHMTRNLDEDEKGRQIVPTPGGSQEMLVINESGLYSAILRSRKAEAKRFKKWVTAEVLPAIRKHDYCSDSHGAMGDLVGAVIGSSGETVLDRVIDQKASPVPAALHRSFKHTMKSRLRSRFNVRRTALIPAECMADACNFVAAYALEGEFIAKESQRQSKVMTLHYPIEVLAARRDGMLIKHNGEQAWLNVTLHDLRDIQGEGTPLESLLWQLESAGHDIRGAWWELRTYRNKLDSLSSFIIGINQAIERPQRYAVGPLSVRAKA